MHTCLTVILIQSDTVTQEQVDVDAARSSRLDDKA